MKKLLLFFKNIKQQMRTTKKLVFITLLLLVIVISAKAQFGTLPPFSIRVEAIGGIYIPGIHSFAFAKSGDKWLFIGGRTNGVHGLNNNDGFDPAYINDNIMVVDTASWQFYNADLNQLPLNIADPLRSTNMEYYQEGNNLYIVGGYGYDSLLSQFTTYPNLTAINVDSMIYAVMNTLPVAPYIRQVTDTNFAVCGGEMDKLGSEYYLMFGHKFTGRYSNSSTPMYTQHYTDRIKKFTINDNGSSITLSPFSYITDTTNFHRRDFTSSPIVKPNGTFAIGAYGGVFQKTADLPYYEPITIDGTGGTVNMGYQQIMSQYTCAVLPVFDSVNGEMYTTFFGGISAHEYNAATSTLVYDTLVPFIKNITTLTVAANGVATEAVLPAQFSERLGANAHFISNSNLTHYNNGVIKFSELPNTESLAGYMFGGIRAVAGNFGVTISNDTIYRIYITPQFNVGVAESSDNINNAQVFPNPSTQKTTLFFNVKKEETIRIALYDVAGKEVEFISNEKLTAGNHQLELTTSRLKAGVYICKVGNQHLSVVVGR